ncbi:MAG: glycosyltransferase family 1 protein [Deltaproteobacteria bacterium]|nr:MAG: glycosyltransferase family 1 protein [Deltaproteobacteria bacterium]
MDAKRVYIDVRPLLESHYSGVGRYVQGLLLALQESLREAPLQGISFHFLTPVSGNTDRLETFDPTLFKTARLPISHGAMNYLVERGIFPPLDLFLPKGLFVFTNYTDIPTIRSDSIAFVYDLSFIVVPEFVDPVNRKFLARRVPSTVRKSKAVVTISESSKNDISGRFGVDPEKIFIVHPSIDRRKFRRATPEAVEVVKKKYGIDGEYLLFVGNIEPRKNISGIMEAYKRLGSGLRDRNRLVLVGSSGWLNEEIFLAIREYQSKGYRIILPNSHVADDDMPALYSGATLFLLPSYYEGFGIPLLEAMACGTPLLTSRNSSLPEVAGDAAIYVDPENPADIAAGIESVLTDERFRRSLVEKGIEQCARFSWRKSAETFRKLIVDRCID